MRGDSDVMLTESEMLGDLFGRNIAVVIEGDPETMPCVTCKAYRCDDVGVPIAVAHGRTLREALVVLHYDLLG